MPEPSNPTWRAFFDSHAPHYLENVFTKWTATEVTFLEAKMGLRPGMTILDAGCGVGRHAIELAKRGYHVTGVDLSPGMLEKARADAREAGVDVEWVESDLRAFITDDRFDAAICLCEGGLGLIDAGDEPISHDLGILSAINRALNPGSPFICTTMNGYATIRQMTDEAVKAGVFDPATMISHYPDTWNLPEGPVSMRIRERLFIPPEFVAMLMTAGFDVLNVWGGTAGEWGERPVKLDEIEVMYVAKKRDA